MGSAMSASSTASRKGPFAGQAVEAAASTGSKATASAGAQTATTKAPRGAVVGAGGVVFDAEGRVLVLHHVDGAWVFPKGHIEAGETSEAAAVREVAEEAGVDAEVLAGAPTWTTDYRNDRGQHRHITWYACTTDATDVTLTERAFPDGGFYPPADAMRLVTHESDRDLLAAVLAAVDGSSRGTP